MTEKWLVVWSLVSIFWVGWMAWMTFRTWRLYKKAQDHLASCWGLSDHYRKLIKELENVHKTKSEI